MASPVTSNDLGSFSQFGDLCERVTRMMGGLDKLKLFLDYLVDSDGEFTQAVRSLGLLPPGVVVAYSTTTSSFDGSSPPLCAPCANCAACASLSCFSMKLSPWKMAWLR